MFNLLVLVLAAGVWVSPGRNMSIPIVRSLVFGAFLHGRRFGLLSLATINLSAFGTGPAKLQRSVYSRQRQPSTLILQTQCALVSQDTPKGRYKRSRSQGRKARPVPAPSSENARRTASVNGLKGAVDGGDTTPPRSWLTSRLNDWQPARVRNPRL